MPSLVVLCGPVGCGKSTLIKKFIDRRQDVIVLDVFKYIQEYKDAEGHIEQEDTLKAYQELYNDLARMDGNLILEIGVNNVEINLENISQLMKKFNVTLVFCLLDKKICIERVLARGKQDKIRMIHISDLEAKFSKPFPDMHRALAGELTIPFTYLNMAESDADLLENLTNLVDKKSIEV